MTPALPFLEAVIVGTVSWDVPPGAASASFRYRREGSVDWIESDTPVAAGRMSAFIDSPGYGTVEYDVNFFKAGEGTPFAYAAGTVMMGNGEPVLTQSVGPRRRRSTAPAPPPLRAAWPSACLTRAWPAPRWPARRPARVH